MPVVEQPISTMPAMSQLQRFDVRWNRLMSTRGEGLIDRNSEAYEHVELVVMVHESDDSHVELEAFVSHAGSRRVVLDRSRVNCTRSFSHGFSHIDAVNDGQRILALSVDAGGVLRYAHSSLLMVAGFHPGTFDRPVYHNFSAALHNTAVNSV